MKEPAPAEEAVPARALKAAEHAVADRDLAHVLAGIDHGADVLVPDREARLDLHAAVVDVQVRATHPRRLDLHDRVAWRRELGLGDVVDPDLAGGLEGDGAHGGDPIAPRARAALGLATRRPRSTAGSSTSTRAVPATSRS